MSVKAKLWGSRRRSRWGRLAALLVGLAVLGGLTLGPAAQQLDHDDAAGDGPARGDGEADDLEAPEADQLAEPAAGSDDAEPAPADSGLGDLAAADPQRRLIREGTVTVGYGDTFEAAHRQVARLARTHGGGVLDVESSTDDRGTTRGAVTVEVPVGAYDDLLDGVGEVGPVVSRDVRTEDVTDEYVDLRSRLRHLERTEQFFLDLFDEADTVDEAITVRDRLDSVQERIEQIEARLRRIEERTEMSRLTVALAPEGEEVHHGPPAVAGFGDYWADAREAFVSVAGTLLVVAVGGAPLALAGAAALAVAVALVRALRSASAAAAE